MEAPTDHSDNKLTSGQGNPVAEFFSRIFGSAKKKESDSEHGHHQHKKRRKPNSLEVWFWKRMEKLAVWAERRRERKKRKRFKREHNRRKRRERWQNHPVKRFLKNLFRRRPRGYYEEYQREAAELKRQRKRLAYFAVNSTLIYIITYFIAYFTYQVAVVFTASRWGINSVIFFYEVFFPIGNNSDKWNSFNIIVITFMGPFISLVMGIIYFIFYIRKDRITGLKKLFFLWLGLHSLNFFLGAFVGGMITFQGFGYVIAWTFMPTWLKFAISLVFLFVLGLVGFLHARFFLESSGSVFWTQKTNKYWLIFFGGFVPWLVSTVFLFFLKYPTVIPQHANIVVYDTIIYMTMIFGVAGIFVNFRATPGFDKTLVRSGTRTINWVYLIVFIGMILIIRLGLNSGFYYLPF